MNLFIIVICYSCLHCSQKAASTLVLECYELSYQSVEYILAFKISPLILKLNMPYICKFFHLIPNLVVCRSP
jgi:hypothetical protein